jgi:hypothetical protein
VKGDDEAAFGVRFELQVLEDDKIESNKEEEDEEEEGEREVEEDE